MGWEIYKNHNLPLNKTIEIPIVAIDIPIVIRAVFHENNKYYPKVFLYECLYRIYMKSKNELKDIYIKNLVLLFWWYNFIK